MGLSSIAELAGSGITTAGSILATQMTNEAQRKIARENNQTSIQIAQENNALQERMNSENNQFSATEAQKSRDFDWQRMQYENEYNSPLAQVQRYKEAGLNPSVMMQGQSAVASSSSGSPAAASPHGSGISPSMPILSTPSFATPEIAGLNIPGALKSFAEAEKLRADAKKAGVESEHLNLISGLLAEDLRQSVIGKQLANDINASFGAKIADANLQKALAETHNLYAQAYKAAQEGNTEESQRLLNEATSEMHKKLGNKYQKEADNMDRIADAQIKDYLSRANKQNAEANEIRTLLPTRQQLLENESKFKESQIRLTNKEVQVNEASRIKLVNETLRIIEETNNLHFTNEQNERLRKYLDDMIIYQSRNEKSEFIWTPWSMAVKAIPGVAIAAGAL